MGSQVLGLEKRLSKYQQSSSMNSVTGRAVRPSAGEARKKERKKRCFFTEENAGNVRGLPSLRKNRAVRMAYGVLIRVRFQH